MKRLSSFLFCLFILFNSFGQEFSYVELKQRLIELGTDINKLKETLVVLSDEVNDRNAESLTEVFDWWGKPLHDVHFVFVGKRKVFKKKLGKSILEKSNVSFDTKEKWSITPGIVMKVFYTSEKRIVKSVSVNNDNFQDEFVNLRAWDLSKLHINTIVPIPSKLLPFNSKAPSINARSIEGEEIDLSNLLGSIVVLNFWADRCAYCIVEMPIFNRINSEYQDENVIVLSIYKDSEESLVKYFEGDKPYFNVNFITFPIVVNAESIMEDYNVESFPRTYIIDQNGVIANTSGFTTYQDETYDFNGFKSDNPSYYLSLKGTIDRLLVE